jgi:hypothetical protein
MFSLLRHGLKAQDVCGDSDLRPVQGVWCRRVSTIDDVTGRFISKRAYDIRSNIELNPRVACVAAEHTLRVQGLLLWPLALDNEVLSGLPLS